MRSFPEDKQAKRNESLVRESQCKSMHGVESMRPEVVRNRYRKLLEKCHSSGSNLHDKFAALNQTP